MGLVREKFPPMTGRQKPCMSGCPSGNRDGCHVVVAAVAVPFRAPRGCWPERGAADATATRIPRASFAIRMWKLPSSWSDVSVTACCRSLIRITTLILARSRPSDRRIRIVSLEIESVAFVVEQLEILFRVTVQNHAHLPGPGEHLRVFDGHVITDV